MFCRVSAPRFFLVALVVFSFLWPGAAQSEENATQTGTESPQKWDVTLGGGTQVKPSYEGSDRYGVSPVPLVNIVWNDMISLSTDGLSIYWDHGDLTLGGGLVYNGGRRDGNGSSLLYDSDSRLHGLGNIDAAMGLKAFATYDIKQFELATSVTKLTGTNNYGVLADVDLSASLEVTKQLILKPHIGATWADQDYMQTYFGVTSAQSMRSRFQRFNAEAGIKDVVAGLNTSYFFNRNWFVTTNIDLTRLVGDAARSPVSFSDCQTVVTAMIGYHF
jgi:outer membrane scaffolding protein for murein synthesis (MipA/OmpV family)